jgi:phosphopantothenoylcysteine decarboxylase/phosphopantothenate--cysteine ligase
MTAKADSTKRDIDGYEVLLCLSGGIACYKVADLASKLVQAGAGVTVAMTEAAQRFICPLTFQALTTRAVYTSLWQSGEDFRSRHISLTERADLMVIAPATADIMAKMAAGLADDLVSTMVISTSGSCPILIVPSMNTRMWNAPATQANFQRLKEWGIETVGPAEGNLACGTVGPGRMVEPDEILAAIANLLHASPPKSKND